MAGHVHPFASYAELIRQRFLPSDKLFLPTTNSRNTNMLKELFQYSRLIKTFLARVKSIQKATEALLKEAEHVVSGPLPREFTMAGGFLRMVGEGLAAVEQATSLDNTKKPASDVLQIAPLLEDLRESMKLQVYSPVSLWQKELDHLRIRCKQLEKTRFELDAVRRSSMKLEVSKARAESLGNLTEKYYRIMKKWELNSVKRKDLEAAYSQEEAALYEDLKAMIQQTKLLKNVFTDAFSIESEVLAQFCKPSGLVEKSFGHAIRPDLQLNPGEPANPAKFTIVEEGHPELPSMDMANKYPIPANKYPIPAAPGPAPVNQVKFPSAYAGAVDPTI